MRRTKEDADKTRNAILLSAENLFFEKGVAHTSLEQIAKHAGVTRGAIYWHFKDKSHLFHAMLSQVQLPPEQFVEQLNGRCPNAPLWALRDMCIEVIAELGRDPQRKRIYTILLHRCEFTEELREAQERYRTLVGQYVEASQAVFTSAAKELQPGVSPRMAATALYGLVIGLLNDWTNSPSLFDAETDTSELIDLLFRGLVRDWHGLKSQCKHG
jgi:TetR/AcrR family transcriptional repressor of mexAB-oprM operon